MAVLVPDNYEPMIVFDGYVQCTIVYVPIQFNLVSRPTTCSAFITCPIID